MVKLYNICLVKFIKDLYKIIQEKENGIEALEKKLSESITHEALQNALQKVQEISKIVMNLVLDK